MGNICGTPADDEFDFEPLELVEAKQKHGYYVSTQPWGFRSSCLHFIKVAEREKGRAPYIVEVAQVMNRDSKWPILGVVFV